MLLLGKTHNRRGRWKVEQVPGANCWGELLQIRRRNNRSSTNSASILLRSTVGSKGRSLSGRVVNTNYIPSPREGAIQCLHHLLISLEERSASNSIPRAVRRWRGCSIPIRSSRRGWGGRSQSRLTSPRSSGSSISPVVPAASPRPCPAHISVSLSPPPPAPTHF